MKSCRIGFFSYYILLITKNENKLPIYRSHRMFSNVILNNLLQQNIWELFFFSIFCGKGLFNHEI